MENATIFAHTSLISLCFIFEIAKPALSKPVTVFYSLFCNAFALNHTMLL